VIQYLHWSCGSTTPLNLSLVFLSRILAAWQRAKVCHCTASTSTIPRTLQWEVAQEPCAPEIVPYCLPLLNTPSQSASTLTLSPATLATDSNLPNHSTINYTHITSNINVQNSTLGSLQFAVTNVFGSNATQIYTQGAGRNVAYNGLLAFQSIQLDSYSYTELNQWCDAPSSDPIVSIPTQLNNIMLRTALTASNRNAAGAQNVAGTRYYSQRVYLSNNAYLGGALAIMFVAVLAVAATFRGWRGIGRTVTLSPVEIAKAFNAS